MIQPLMVFRSSRGFMGRRPSCERLLPLRGSGDPVRALGPWIAEKTSTGMNGKGLLSDVAPRDFLKIIICWGIFWKSLSEALNRSFNFYQFSIFSGDIWDDQPDLSHPCGPDPRKMRGCLKGKEPGYTSAAVDLCHQQTSVARSTAVIPESCFKDGFVSKGHRALGIFFFCWQFGNGSKQIMTISIHKPFFIIFSRGGLVIQPVFPLDSVWLWLIIQPVRYAKHLGSKEFIARIQSGSARLSFDSKNQGVFRYLICLGSVKMLSWVSWHRS